MFGSALAPMSFTLATAGAIGRRAAGVGTGWRDRTKGTKGAHATTLTYRALATKTMLKLRVATLRDAQRETIVAGAGEARTKTKAKAKATLTTTGKHARRHARRGLVLRRGQFKNLDERPPWHVHVDVGRAP